MLELPSNLKNADVARSFPKLSNYVLNEPSPVVLDLHGVNQFDSSALALLLALSRLAKKRSKDVQFVNVPKRLCELAELYGVYDLLSIGIKN
jgi:phospholipid transport system transporter-binding protein